MVILLRYISLYQYIIIQPRVKSVCEKYKIPYIQENVFKRLIKTVDIMIGKTSMIEIDSIENYNFQLGNTNTKKTD